MNKYITLLLIAAVSLFFLFIVTPYNVGVSSDSVYYIESAKNITNGKGYTINNKFVTHWPPLYSVILAISSIISNMDPLSTGKYMNAVLFLFTGLVFLQILKKLKFNIKIQYSILIIWLFSKPLWAVSIMLWSEVPFLLIVCTIFLYYLKWKETQKKNILLTVGALSALAFLTRYAAIGIIGGFILNILLLRGKKIQEKLIETIYFICPIIFGAAAWVFSTHCYADSTTNRDIVYHIIPLEKILYSIWFIARWFYDDNYSFILLILTIIACSYLIYANKSKLKYFFESNNSNIRDTAIIILSYYSFLLLSISLFDAHTPLNNRILAPIAPFIFILLGYCLNFVTEHYNNQVSYSICVIMILLCSYSAKNKWIYHHNNGNAYTSKYYNQYVSDVKNYVLNYEGETYSNDWVFIRFISNDTKNLKRIPVQINTLTREKNSNYPADINSMFDSISNKNSQLFCLDKINHRWYLMPKEEILDRAKIEDVILTKINSGYIIRKSKK